MTDSDSNVIHVCRPRFLSSNLLDRADEIAMRIRPDNEDRSDMDASTGERLAVDRRVYWGSEGVRLTVGFLDNPTAELRRRILAHMNAWNERGANIEFVESNDEPQVRIARLDGPPSMAGYWSYLGTDILTIPADEPTMNLEGFTMSTPESEFRRVVRHETGHTLGFPHEHMRKEIISKLDHDKTFAYFWETEGWSKSVVRQQVLTALEDGAIIGTRADPRSIMCYDAPAEITKDGKPIPGGTDIDESDYEFVDQLYPPR